MMTSTHMAAGFVLSGISYRLLAQLFPYYVRSDLLLLFPYVLVAGLVGGLFPDLDRMEREILGFRVVHRKTLHFIVGYASAGGLVAVLLLLHPEHAWILGPLFAFLLSAWAHTVMDVFDGEQKGRPGAVYEHFTRRWIRGKEVIPFASTKEWILYSAIAMGFIVFAIYPYPITLLGSDLLTLPAVFYVLTWIPAAVYEWKYVAPKRRDGHRAPRTRRVSPD